MSPFLNHGGVIKERAVGFADTADMSADGISRKILEVLEPLELYPSLCGIYFRWCVLGNGLDACSSEANFPTPCSLQLR